MDCLDDLPVELVLNVAFRLSKHQPSLASLARVAQKYRPIAEEVLYETPILPDVESSVSSARLFLRTLLAKPEYAKRVKTLSLPIVKQHGAHPKYCIAPDVCVCGLLNLRDHLTDTVAEWEETHVLNPTGMRWSQWASHVSCAFKPALGGVILKLLPNLQDMWIWTCDRSRHTWDLMTGAQGSPRQPSKTIS